MLGILEGRNLCLGDTALFALPPSCGPAFAVARSNHKSQTEGRAGQFYEITQDANHTLELNLWPSPSKEATV